MSQGIEGISLTIINKSDIPPTWMSFAETQAIKHQQPAIKAYVIKSLFFERLNSSPSIDIMMDSDIVITSPSFFLELMEVIKRSTKKILAAKDIIMIDNNRFRFLKTEHVWDELTFEYFQNKIKANNYVNSGMVVFKEPIVFPPVVDIIDILKPRDFELERGFFDATYGDQELLNIIFSDSSIYGILPSQFNFIFDGMFAAGMVFKTPNHWEISTKSYYRFTDKDIVWEGFDNLSSLPEKPLTAVYALHYIGHVKHFLVELLDDKEHKDSFRDAIGLIMSCMSDEVKMVSIPQIKKALKSIDKPTFYEIGTLLIIFLRYLWEGQSDESSHTI